MLITEGLAEPLDPVAAELRELVQERDAAMPQSLKS
jgi:hypothetical protein